MGATQGPLPTSSNGPLGFDLSEREVKRAGLDHWNHVDLRVHDSWRRFLDSTLPLLDHDDATNTTATTTTTTHESAGDGNRRGSIYLVSKRLKLGCTHVSDVDFFPTQPSPPAPPPPPKSTRTLKLANTAGPAGDLIRDGSPDGGSLGGRPGVTSTMGGGSGGDGGISGSGGSNSSGGGGSGDVALVFGNEVDGLSGLQEGPMGRSLPAVYLPMRDDVIRSYNLANAVAMAVYEVERQRRESRRQRGEPIEEWMR